MKVLVTGGSGFIGTNLVQAAIDANDTVLNIDCSPPRNPNHINFWKEVNLLNFTKLETAVKEFSPDVIYHMAARTDLDGRSLQDYDVNTVGVLNLIKSLDNLGNLQRVIFASSRLVCRIGYQPKNDFDH